MLKMKDYPDHHDAELVLRLYELRREPLMREARSVLYTKFMPRTFDEFSAIMKSEHEHNAFYRQVNTYWEMAYGLIKHGVLNADLAMESNGEGMLLFAKAQPWLAEIRAMGNPRSFANAEWVATETDAGRRVFAMFDARIRQATGR